MNPLHPIAIRLTQPCSASWHDMTGKGNKRLCAHCGKEVIDFSRLSEEALHHYFAGAKQIPCGRFLSTQLDTAIAAPKRKQGWLQAKRSLAALIALMGIQFSGTAAAQDTLPQTHASLQRTAMAPDKIRISGKVKDDAGHPLENANVTLDNNIVVKTDRDGNFQLDLSSTEAATTHVLSVQFPGLTGTARSYHPFMGATFYDILLEKSSCCYSMGTPVTVSLVPVDINIGNKEKSLSLDAAQQLAVLAETMRQNPQINFIVTGYAHSHRETLRVRAWQYMIIRRLVDEEGISSERLKSWIEGGSAKKPVRIEPEIQSW